MTDILLTPDELEAELDAAHAGDASEADIEAALSSLLDDRDDEPADDGPNRGDISDVAAVRCPLCDEHVNRDDFATHFSDCRS